MTGSAATGSAVVLVDERLGAVLPAAALAVLRAADDVYAGSDLPLELAKALSLPPAPAELTFDRAVVVIAVEPTEPSAAALLAAGAPVLATEPPAGTELLSAVAVMDRLRSPGGCPWDAEQTHESLRQYLVEETFELLEAIEDGDRAGTARGAGRRAAAGAVPLPGRRRGRGRPVHGFDEVAADLVASSSAGTRTCSPAVTPRCGTRRRRSAAGRS